MTVGGGAGTSQCASNVLLCYVPGLDLRRIDTEHTPFLAGAMQAHAFAELQTLPSSELLSTLVTGALPHEHGIWQTALKAPRPLTRRERLTDSLSDFVTTTAQCVRHQLVHDCDVPSIPPRRRRQFEFRRIKFRGRVGTSALIAALDRVPSLIDAVGTRDFRFRFTDRVHDRETLLEQAGRGEARLELLQFHAMDALGHWRIETAEEFRHYYGLTDAFLRALHARCRERGVTMVMVSDHGQEPVTGSFDLARHIRGLGVPRDEYAFFLQAIMVRFWFHTDRARVAILDMLSRIPNGRVLSSDDLREYGMAFRDDTFGAVYFVADPGVVFFPNDFHHPLVNLVMGLRDWQQRKRLRNPRHLAYHGYLPHHPSEKGFMLVFDERFALERPSFHLRDVAPSVLDMLGVEQPGSMTGVSRVRR